MLLVTGGNAILWLFLARVITRHIHARTCHSIDALLANMAVAGRSLER